MKEKIRQAFLWQAQEKLKIDPMIDCVFKAILGKKENERIRIHV